jgi:dihydroneopterin aldolase
MITISLHGATFFAYHGFYPEEQKLGNCFMIDIEVGYEPTVPVSEDEIGNNVNYEQLYDIACEQMKHTRKLIETVAQAILNDINAAYPDVESIEVVVKKMNPALGHKVDYSAVTVNYNKA